MTIEWLESDKIGNAEMMPDWAHRHVANHDAELAQYLAVWA